MDDAGNRNEGDLLRYEPLAAVAIVALAAMLRLRNLFGWWPNPDEGIYYGVVTVDGLGPAWAEAWATAHPPLYFFILRLVGALSTDFALLRSVALVSGCTAVYVFVLLGRELDDGLTGRVTGLVAGLILAVSPRAIVLSQVMRPYMLLLLLLSASALFLLRYLRTPATRLLLGHLACSLLAVLLHYSAVFGLAVIGTLVLLDGARRGVGRTAWRRLMAAQLAPAVLFAGLYLSHLRGVAAGTLGELALDGWLSGYMIRGLLDAWFGLVGFHSMLVGDAWAAPATLFALGSLVSAAWLRGWHPVPVMAAAGVGVGIAGAALQLYPFGPTRHAAWLLVFVIPLIAWTLAALLTSPRRRLIAAGPAVVVSLIVARALTPMLDPEERPREISEHVLEEAAVAAMADVLDPGGEPPVVVMSNETYEQLTPLYAIERQSAEWSEDGTTRHFRWGARDVIVLPTRDFATRREELGQLNHLYTGSLRAEAEFDLELPRGGEPVLVLSGGWRSQGMIDLVELANRVGSMGTTTAVPGLIAVYLDLDAYGRALGVPGP